MYKNKIKSFLTGAKGKVLAISTVVTGTAMTGVTAFAEDAGTGTDVAAVTSALSTGLDSTKATFLAILGIVVVSAMAFFAVKYGVNQGIAFFSKISKKG